jgi:hypothetical protein
MSVGSLPGGDIERTPEQEYTTAARDWQEATARRDATRQQLNAIVPDAIYYLCEREEVAMIEPVTILKSTVKQYRVRYLEEPLTLPRPLIDRGEIADNKGRRFASGSTLRPILRQQLVEQAKVVERCAGRMEATWQSAQRAPAS